MARPALVPELYVSDLASSLDFYTKVLGFRIEYTRPEEKFATLSLGSAWLMLEEAPSLSRASPEAFARGELRTADLERPFGRGVNLEIEVANIDTAANRIRASVYSFLREVHEKTYRIGSENRKTRQLLVADPDGYLIRLSHSAIAADRLA